MFKLPVHKVPITEKNSVGIDIRILIKGLMSNIVKVIYEPDLISLAKTKQKHFLTIVTQNNYIKKMDLDDFMNVAPSGLLYTKVNGDDVVKDVQIVPFDSDIIIYSNKKALRIGMDQVPHFKRSTLGNLAMNTKDPIDGFTVLSLNSAPYIIATTENGKVNKISASALPKSDRNKAGNNVIKLAKGDKLFSVNVLNDNNKLIAKCMNGTQEILVKDIPILSSISSGTKMINTKNNAIVRIEVE